MLVLTRSNGEGIQIETKDGPVKVHATATSNGRVRLAIDAPVQCPILRLEKDGSITDRNKAKCKVQ